MDSNKIKLNAMFSGVVVFGFVAIIVSDTLLAQLNKNGLKKLGFESPYLKK